MLNWMDWQLSKYEFLLCLVFLLEAKEYLDESSSLNYCVMGKFMLVLLVTVNLGWCHCNTLIEKQWQRKSSVAIVRNLKTLVSMIYLSYAHLRGVEQQWHQIGEGILQFTQKYLDMLFGIAVLLDERLRSHTWQVMYNIPSSAHLVTCVCVEH